MVIVFRQIDNDKFEAVRNGSKPVETRAATPKFKSVKQGDVIIFKCGKDKFEKRVKSVQFFKSITELAQEIPPARIFPNASSPADLKKMYYGFPNYKDKIAKQGLVAWELSD